MTARKRHVVRQTAMALCAVFIVVFILSELFVFTHVEHEHDCYGHGGGCATCAQLAIAENLLLTVSASVAGIALASGVVYVVIALLVGAAGRCDRLSPVRLRVRLNY